MMWGYGGGWEAIMIIVMLAVIALVVVGIVFLVRALSHPGTGRFEDRGQQSWHGPGQGPPPPAGGRSRALDVLEERYARGEIDRDEFLRRRQDILGGGGQ